MSEYFDWGDPISGEPAESLRCEASRRVLAACHACDFQLVDLCRRIDARGHDSDVLVVDCVNPRVPSKNDFGIKVRERLALVFPVDRSAAPEARALRKDFPSVPHLNHVPRDEPAWLCVYFEPWAAVERAWTGPNYLRRLAWWLEETAKGTLHRGDQPVEAFYLESPYELVLPPEDSAAAAGVQRHLELVRVPDSTGEDKTFRARPCGAASAALPWLLLEVTLDAVAQGRIEPYPETLGELVDRAQGRGADLRDPLVAQVRAAAAGGARRNIDQRCLLLIRTPMKRTPDGPVERTDVRGVLMNITLAELGRRLEALVQDPNDSNVFRHIPLIGTEARLMDQGEWRSEKVAPVAIRWATSPVSARRASGVGEGADFVGVIAGVGSLGGALADIWSREGWGKWSFVDPDVLRPHNVTRHVLKDCFVGVRKAEGVRRHVEANYAFAPSPASISKSVSEVLREEKLRDIFGDADLIVDVTTTLDVPRDLAANDRMGRTASIFMTPSGMASALLLEDQERRVRVDALEAQYYRALLNEGWGAKHLTGHLAELWVGAGCREVTGVLSYGTVQAHAGILSKQLRRLRERPEAVIRVWTFGFDGDVTVSDVSVREPVVHESDGWSVITDAVTHDKLGDLRAVALPAETGGIVLGYVDHKTKRIFVVDVQGAPPDSHGDGTGFVRGVAGLEASVEEARGRTGHVVGYIGEWHSHPPFVAPKPSGEDKILLKALAQGLERDGQPALMIIVGTDRSIGVFVEGVGAPRQERPASLPVPDEPHDEGQRDT